MWMSIPSISTMGLSTLILSKAIAAKEREMPAERNWRGKPKPLETPSEFGAGEKDKEVEKGERASERSGYR